MPTRNGTSSADIIDLTLETATPSSTSPATQGFWTVNAKAGNDAVYGSEYNDWVYGGDGNDTIYGNPGMDVLYGEAGNDLIYGGDDNDKLQGGDGTDYLYGESGTDSLYGDAGTDYLYGGDDNDMLVGGAGNDTMYGGDGNDNFFGDAGVDIMKGEGGNDTYRGGTGNDKYYFDGNGLDTVKEGETNTGTDRSETTYDTADRLYVSYTSSDIYIYDDGANNLVVTSSEDYSDGVADEGVVISNFFSGGHYVVETLITSDLENIDLTTYMTA